MAKQTTSASFNKGDFDLGDRVRRTDHPDQVGTIVDVFPDASYNVRYDASPKTSHYAHQRELEATGEDRVDITLVSCLC